MRGQGRIFRRGETWWIAYSRSGQEFRESSASAREADAKRLLRQRLGEIHAGRFVGPVQERVTFGELLDGLIRDYQINGKRNLPTVKGHVKHLRAAFGLDRAVDVTEVRIERYKQERLAPVTVTKAGGEAEEKPGAAPATVNRELSALSRAFRLAVEQKLLTTKPLVKKLREDNTRQGFVERADFEVVCAHLPPYLQDFARYAFFTGWRKGEVASLTWGDVDLAGRTIRLRGTESKNSHGRVVALEGDLHGLILRREEERRVTGPSGEVTIAANVFHHHGQPIGDFRKAWETAATKAGHPDLLFHDFRRSAVRNLTRAGVSQKTCMEITGHKTDHVFRRYDIVDERDLREAARRVQAYLDSQPAEPTVVPMQGAPRKQA
jgi:integrase